jgi:HAD superfamily hydrolase (TIGR01509 family)
MTDRELTCEEVIEQLFDFLDHRLDEAQSAEFHRHLERCRECFSRAEFERRLRERGMPQAIVSNSDRMLVDANLRAIGLAEPDLVTVTHNDVRAGKPQPEPYLRAAWLLHAAPPDCVVIEDSPTGAAAGVAAGMTVVGIVGHGASASDFPSGTTTVESVDEAALRTLLDG